MAKDTEVLACRLNIEEARKVRCLATLRGGWMQEILREGIQMVLADIPQDQQGQLERLVEAEGIRNATP